MRRRSGAISKSGWFRSGSPGEAQSGKDRLLTGLPTPPGMRVRTGRFTNGEYPSHHFKYSYRGLSPHQIMPMSGVHYALNANTAKRRRLALRWIS